MTNQRCPICGRPHAPGACPTSGAGSGAPRSILGGGLAPPLPFDRGDFEGRFVEADSGSQHRRAEEGRSDASVDPGLALLADAGLLGVAERYAALRRVDRTHAEALYSALIEMVTRDALITPIRDDAASPWAGDDVQHWPRAMTRAELGRDNASVWEEATREIPADLAGGLGVAINRRIAARYDELMLEGKHGHYETMFRVMQEIADTLANDEPAPAAKPEPTGPAPWMAPRGECRSCDRRRGSQALAKKQKKVPKP